jgi:hypothetical protein
MGHAAAVELLLKHKINDIEVKNPQQMTPLLKAAIYLHPQDRLLSKLLYKYKLYKKFDLHKTYFFESREVLESSSTGRFKWLTR